MMSAPIGSRLGEERVLMVVLSVFASVLCFDWFETVFFLFGVKKEGGVM